MSDFHAIGGVSATLKKLLEERMELPTGVSKIQVTVSTPRPTSQGEQALEAPRVNLFLYQVTENGYLKNQEIPGQGHPASYGQPPLSLELHYLLTAYGTTSETDGELVNETRAHYLLGSAMRVLHDDPVISEEMELQNGGSILDESLRGEFEKVKLYLDPVSLEDLSKVWTALTQPYRLSAAYTVSVVQIESEQPRHFPRPVGEPLPEGPRVYVLPFRTPQIREVRVIRQEDLERRERPFAYARVGDTLVIRGRNLAGDATRVNLDGVDATHEIAILADDRIQLAIPDDVALQPGARSVRIAVDVMMGEPPRPHTGFQSNTAVFMLVPHIKKLDAAGSPGALVIEGTRLFHEDLESLTLVGDRVIYSGDYTSATPTKVVFNLPSGMESGDYAVRVRVHGAESIDNMILSI